MTYEIVGGRPGAARRPSAGTKQASDLRPDEKAKDALDAAEVSHSSTVLRRRGRIQASVMAAIALCLLVGAQLGTRPHAITTELTDRALQGAWQLQSVGGDPIGPKVASGILSQQVFFDHGKIRGETRLLAATPAGTTQMPFPDQSVKQITVGPEGYDATAIWEGTYRLLDAHRMALYVGQARYIIKGAVDLKTHSLTLDPDTILTYQGAARYKHSGR